MLHRARKAVALFARLSYLCLSLLSVALAADADAQTVWSGLTYSFSRPDGVDGTLPQYQDALTDDSAFARAGAGLFNPVSESFFDPPQSPLGTEWATTLIVGNESATIAATNYANLMFGTFTNAYGGFGGVGHNIVGRDAVVHLIDEDIYLDIRFTSWTTGRQDPEPGFALMRAVPEPSSAVVALFGTIAFGLRVRNRLSGDHRWLCDAAIINGHRVGLPCPAPSRNPQRNISCLDLRVDRS